MGKSLAKIGLDNEAGSAVKSVDAEFDYRCHNTKSLRTSVKALIKALHDTNISMMSTPTRFVSVGESFMAVNACMNHGGAGGASQSTNNRGAASGAAAEDEGPDMSPEADAGGGTGRTKVNRALAKETYESAQAFAESMRKLKEQDFQKFRQGVEADVIKKADEICAEADNTLAIAREAETAASKHATTAKKVDKIERKCAKKSTEPSANMDYAAAVGARDEAEKTAQERKNAFHESYEALMAHAQDFSVQAMDRFMDLNVTYNREFIRVMDVSGSPMKGRSAARAENHEPNESHEPSENHEPNKS